MWHTNVSGNEIYDENGEIHMASLEKRRRYLSELKVNPVLMKNSELQKYMGTTCSADRLPHLMMKYRPCGNETKDDPLKTLPDC
jgi:hypothetical protein